MYCKESNSVLFTLYRMYCNESNSVPCTLYSMYCKESDYNASCRTLYLLDFKMKGKLLCLNFFEGPRAQQPQLPLELHAGN